MLNEYKIQLRRPHAGQRQVIATEGRFNVLACGRRFGKTEYGKERAYRKMFEGKPVAWFSPTYRMMAEVWRGVKRKLAPITVDSNASEHRLEIIGGGSLEMWSLENYDAVRGRKYALAIVDEAAAVKQLKDAWQAAIRSTLVDMRGGAYFLSTPRGDNFFKELFDLGQSDNQEWASWQMPTATNPFINAEEIEAMRVEMSSRLYEQEIMARFIADLEGALWTRLLLDENRVTDIPDYFQRIVVSIDPGINADSQGETGIVVTGLDYDAHCYILEDCTTRGTPEGWARQAISAYERWQADRIIVERNQGGDMVAATLRTVDPTVPITEVHASRGKVTRAEPVVALYEQGLVHHVGFFPALENQLCGWVPGDPSPDRLDAMVWGVWALKLSDDLKKVAQVRTGKKIAKGIRK